MVRGAGAFGGSCAPFSSCLVYEFPKEHHYVWTSISANYCKLQNRVYNHGLQTLFKKNHSLALTPEQTQYCIMTKSKKGMAKQGKGKIIPACGLFPFS